MDSEYLRLSRRIKRNQEVSTSYVADTLMPVGSMLMWTSETLPTGWLLCDGTAVSRTTYEDLYETIGTTYGVGDNSTTFNLPNLKGKFPIGIDDSDTDFDALGETGGAKDVTLSESELPSHDHSIAHDHASATTDTQSASHTHGVNPPTHRHSLADGVGTAVVGSGTGSVVASGNSGNTGYYNQGSFDSDTQSASHTHGVDLPNYTGDSGNAGSGSAHENMPPFLTVSFIINYQDFFWHRIALRFILSPQHQPYVIFIPSSRSEYFARGIENINFPPFSWLLSAQIFLLWKSKICRPMVNLTPLPCGLPRESSWICLNSSNTISRLSWRIPTLLSST